MSKKTPQHRALIILFCLCIFTVGFPKSIYAQNLYETISTVQNDLFTLDQSNQSKGYVSIKKESDIPGKYKVIVSKDNDDYIYDLNYAEEKYPLQMGDGEYQINLYKELGENEYILIHEWAVDVKIDSPKRVFLISNSLVSWKENSAAALQAQKITAGLKTDKEKAYAIYTYIVNNFKYNDKKAKGLKSGYVPNPEDILKSKDGICYDFSSLYAAMLRSNGIPAKLVMGTTTNVTGYHAWNEILLDNKWVIVDTSYDIQAKASKARYTMIKSNVYTKEKQF